MRDVRQFLAGEVAARSYLRVAEERETAAAMEHQPAVREAAARDALEARRSAALRRLESYVLPGAEGEALLAKLDWWLGQHVDRDGLVALGDLLDPKVDRA